MCGRHAIHLDGQCAFRCDDEAEPDEYLGQEIGMLDRGDEVEVLRQEASFVLVMTPDEAIGWVHRTTLRAPELA